MPVNSPIKIVQLFDEYPVFYQPYIPPVIEALSNSKSLDIQIMAFNGQRSKSVEIIPSYYKRKFQEKIYQVINGSSPKLNIAEIRFLKKNIDIVHLQHSYLFPKILGLLQLDKKSRPKIVITLRGGDTYVKPWVNNKWKSFYQKFGDKVDCFIVMSNHQKEYLHSKWGVGKEKIQVIPISFGMKFSIAPKKVNSNQIKIISIFRMCWEKNISGNLMVIRNLIDRGLPVRYEIYGDGPDAGQVWYLIDKYGLSTNVFYHGKLENEILKKRINESDFLLQLSHSEAFPTTVIEAQSNGLPALISTAGGLPESIIPNKSGYCVETFETQKGADYIEQLWRNSKMYTEFSAAAINHSQSNFSLEEETIKLENLYNYIN